MISLFYTYTHPHTLTHTFEHTHTWRMANISGVEDTAWERVMEVLTVLSVPMALQAAVKLNVMEILAFEDKELSASEIVAVMKAKYKPSISNLTAHIALDRILRLLATHGLLSSSLQEEEGDRQLPVKKYGITAVSRYFASEPSLGALLRLTQQKPFTDAWQLLDQAVLEGTDAFTLAHGKSPFLFGQEDPHFVKAFNAGMASYSALSMPFVLRSYDGFLSVNTLVDVGGGAGACLSAIVSKYPHIKGINFDQPHVVAAAPSYPGVEHVGGDMFKSIPKGDAIFMRDILHNWSDESCVEILKNCYKALPANGKVIVVDIMLSPRVETTPTACVQTNMDVTMLAFYEGGKERTLQETQHFANAAGFGRVNLVTQVLEKSIVELHKG